VHRPVFVRRHRFVHRPFFHRRRHFAPAFLTAAAFAPSFYADDCFVVRRKVVNRWGDIVIRRRVVCS
jgi:hypothetical protein